MPRVSDVYGGSYLKAIQIGDDSYKLDIVKVQEELVGEAQERKLVVYFRGTSKGLVMNATNANTLAESYGDDTDKWVGHRVRLFTVDTEFGGRRVKGLRVEPVDTEKPHPQVDTVQKPPWERGQPAADEVRGLEEFSNEALSEDPDDLPF